MKKRNSRQDAIRDIVRTSSVRTQRALVDELRRQGFNCTQATVSHDITDMGLRKLGEGGYVLGEDLRLQRLLTEFVVETNRAQNLVVVKCQPGTAHAVAAAIDAAELDDVLGSVSGDDTVLVICGTDHHGEEIVLYFEKLRDSR